MSADQYLRYDPSVEQIRPEEAAAVEEIVASISRTSDRTFHKDKHGTRQQHAKGAGYLRGELIVYEDSYGLVTLAISRGDAARLTGASVGDELRIVVA